MEVITIAISKDKISVHVPDSIDKDIALSILTKARRLVLKGIEKDEDSVV